MGSNAMPSIPDDEVDVRLLMGKLWRARRLILAITAISTLCAVAYAFLVSPVYQVQVQVLPPTRADLVAYNVVSRITKDSGSDIEEIAPGQAYRVFTERLKSDTIKEAFFERFYQPAMKTGSKSRDELLEAMGKKLRIVVPREGEQVTTLTMRGPDPKRVSDWANSYVALAMDAATRQLIKDLNREVEIRMSSVSTQLEAYRRVAKAGRENQILRLKDAASIARNIGLESPMERGAMVTVEQQRRTLNMDGPVSSGMLYMQGYRALESQLQQLEQRVSDDPYIPELPGLLTRHVLLTRIDVKPDSFRAARVDAPAEPPDGPVEPNKPLVIAIGVVCGLMLGVLVALALPGRKRERAF